MWGEGKGVGGISIPASREVTVHGYLSAAGIYFLSSTILGHVFTGKRESNEEEKRRGCLSN